MSHHVLHVLASLAPGGAERLATHLICGLDRTRFDPAVLLLYDRTGSDLEERLDAAGIPIHALRKRGPGARPLLFARAARALRTLEPDVVHTHGYPLAYILPAFWTLRVPVGVHTVHTEADKESRRRASRVLHRLAFSTGVHPVFASWSIRRSFERLYPQRHGVVIENGIPLGPYGDPFGDGDRVGWRAAEGYRPEDRLVVFTGRLEEVKQPVALVTAFARVAARDPLARLLLVGEGSLHDAVDARIAALGLEGIVRTAGFRTDIPNVLRAADLFVLNSRYEGLPLAVIEAMASGLPVVAPRVGGLPEVVEATGAGRLTRPGDQTALAAAIVALLANPEVRQRHGRAAREAVAERFDVVAMVRRYEALYTRLLDERGVTGT